MFRLWGKIFKDNRMLKDTVICDDTDDTRTHKIFHALDEVCYQFDLSKPIWLDSTIAEFKKHDKARFYQDNFVDSIDFDYLEIHIIEEEQMREVSFSKATSPIIIFQIAIHFELLQADLISLLVVPGSILPPFPQESQMQVKSAQAKVEYKKLHLSCPSRLPCFQPLY